MADEKDPENDNTFRITLLATGGTIAFRAGRMRLEASDLIDTVLDDIAPDGITLVGKDLKGVPSTSLTPSDILDIVGEAEAALEDSDAVIITHGTDTMEETGYLLGLHWNREEPIVLTGAMRPATSPGSDGPRNLLASCLVAANSQTIGKGPLAVMHDKIFAADDITKIHTWDTDTFVANSGPMGWVDPWNRVTYVHDSTVERTTLPRPGGYSEPVAVVTVGLGSDGSEIDALFAGGYRGVVLATAGRGGIPRSMRESLRSAMAGGMVVAASSRCPLGGVHRSSGDDGILWTGMLNPHKARLLLMTGMALHGTDRAALAKIFR